MSRIATARKVAKSIVTTINALTKRGDAALIDNMWSPAIALANSIHEGYVTGITAEGAQYLMSVNYQLIALNVPTPARTPGDLFDGTRVECVTPHGVRLTLSYAETGINGVPVTLGETINEVYPLDGTFIVTGAVWRDDIDEARPCVVGRWTHDGPDATETYPMSSRDFGVRWTAL